MPVRFPREARRVAEGAREVARAQGVATVEAEHLLLALADRAGGPVADVLAGAGLDGEALLKALDAETARSLAAVGVSRAAFDLPAAAPAARAPRWGTSAKLALQRSLRAAVARGDRSIGPGHVLLGVLGAEHGTVPRALRIAGVDRQELADRAEAALPQRG